MAAFKGKLIQQGMRTPRRYGATKLVLYGMSFQRGDKWVTLDATFVSTAGLDVAATGDAVAHTLLRDYGLATKRFGAFSA
jgi:hypothetical protein